MTRPMIGARYSAVAIALHWTIALFVIINLVVGIGHDAVPALRAWMPAHKSIGITVLVLTLARLAWRLGHRAPPLPAEVKGWERGAAHAVHGLFYVVLILLPLSGWAMVSSPDRKKPLDWFGVFDVPFLSVSRETAHFGGGAHGLLGWLMLALVVIHIAGALRHQFLLRDNLVARMLPGSAR